MTTEREQKTILIYTPDKQFGENIKVTIEKITHTYSIGILLCYSHDSLLKYLEERVDIDILMLEFQDGDEDEIEIIHQIRNTQPAHARIIIFSMYAEIVNSQKGELAKLIPVDRFIKGHGSESELQRNHFPGNESTFLSMLRNWLGAF